jgi:2-amino-4-hydroxy-6-hydroxymethyldihydropteridine diphosphokinase
MPITYLLLGSNLGKRDQNLETALKHIHERIGTVTKKSRIYQTEPWGERDQEDFLNQALEVDTKLKPKKILKKSRIIHGHASAGPGQAMYMTVK